MWRCRRRRRGACLRAGSTAGGRSAGGACTHRGLLGERERSSGLVLAARCRNYIYSTNFETTLNQIVVILETRLAEDGGGCTVPGPVAKTQK